MLLDEYLFRMGMTKKDFAKLIDIRPIYLGQIMNGHHNCTVKLARRIEEATKGKVTKEEMLFPEEHAEKRLSI